MGDLAATSWHSRAERKQLVHGSPVEAVSQQSSKTFTWAQAILEIHLTYILHAEKTKVQHALKAVRFVIAEKQWAALADQSKLMADIKVVWQQLKNAVMLKMLKLEKREGAIPQTIKSCRKPFMIGFRSWI